ncbi:MAG: formylglycine-generating enzyme family protein [Deltaproteobacteria bacterium]|jgi:formylglycine-generating enzyme required for sulfatase activity|nr:formylglycine-generating enzyme family protein [Deltaproteobacteria bacterium]
MLSKPRLYLILSFSLVLCHGAPQALADETTNSLGMKFTLIRPGTFTMGANPNREDTEFYETPQHEVTITKPFYLGVHEVTQSEWQSVMGENPAYFRGNDLPIENISWDEALAFTRALNRREGTDKYRLPTEAEWEYSARAGTTTDYFFGDDGKPLDKYAWYWENGGEKTHPVGLKRPNPWGLYDIYGNVWEWTNDVFGMYLEYAITDPVGPIAGAKRVDRGCSWYYVAYRCRSADRYGLDPNNAAPDLGFRLAYDARK